MRHEVDQIVVVVRENRVVQRLFGQRQSGRRQVCGALALIGFAFACTAAADNSFPGRGTSQGTIAAQQKADRLFEKGKYDRAMFIYREDLAPVGDKFAQYMIGYMYLTGKGVEQDVPVGVAWYRLAAERGEASFVKAHDEILAQLEDDQLTRSDSAYRELREQFGDVAVLCTMITRDLELLRENDDPLVARRLEHRSRYLLDLTASRENVAAEELQRVDQLVTEVAGELNRFVSKN